MSETKLYTFYDLFDLDDIQRIQDEVAKSLHVGSIITEPDGTPITKPSNFCTFCYNVVRSSPVGCENCKKSDSVLGRPCPGKPTISPCLSASLMDAGCSIIVNGQHIASWMLGQVRNADKPTTREQNAEYARKLGIDVDLYCHEFEKIPQMTEEEFSNIAHLIFIITEQISNQAVRNIQLQDELDRRNVLENQLQIEHIRLSYSSTHDMLTNVYNRGYYDEQIARLTEENIYPVSIVVGDVNNLKITNDVFGHKHGDILLIKICDIMRKAAKEDYIICRCGGDEFHVIMPNAGYNEAKEFCKTVKELCSLDSTTVIAPSISFGFDTRTSDKKPLSSVLRTADALMYKNKQADKITTNILLDIERILYNKKYLNEEIVERTLILSNAFGIYLKLDNEQLQDLNLLTELQDLGMIVVPENIFFKSGPLSEEEFDMIKSHPAISYRLARLYDNTLSVAKAAQHCHENYDGSGYPGRLSGQNIPYLSRIMSLINGYIAMVCERPYGREMSHKEALDEITKNLGSQFDPNLGEDFVKFMEDYVF